MNWRNTPQEWGAVAKFFHWSIALLVIGLVIVGLIMDEMRNSPDKITVYAIHKSVGLTVLVLALLRLVWRFVDPRPPYPPSIPSWQRQASDLTHGLLYALLIYMPITGWLFNSAANFPLQWFWLFKVPALSGPDAGMKELARDLHGLGFYALAALFTLHVGAALRHHFVDRDPTLARMVPGLRAPSSPSEETA